MHQKDIHSHASLQKFCPQEVARSSRRADGLLTYPKASICRLDHKHSNVAAQHPLVVILLADDYTKALPSVKG